jgi:DNA/RNA endonuclease G (NUC1)
MVSENEVEVPRNFWKGILDIRNELNGYEVPSTIVEETLDQIQDEILEALEHAGEEQDEDEEDED